MGVLKSLSQKGEKVLHFLEQSCLSFYQGQGGNKYLVLSVLEAGSPRSRYQHVWVLVRALFLICGWPFSCCVLTVLSRERLHKSHHQGPPSWPNHLPKALPPNATEYQDFNTWTQWGQTCRPQQSQSYWITSFQCLLIQLQFSILQCDSDMARRIIMMIMTMMIVEFVKNWARKIQFWWVCWSWNS